MLVSGRGIPLQALQTTDESEPGVLECADEGSGRTGDDEQRERNVVVADGRRDEADRLADDFVAGPDH